MPSAPPLITQIVQYFPPAFSIIAFLYLAKAQRRTTGQIDLEELLGRALSAGAIPPSLVLLVCSFKPDLLPKLSGFNIYIAIAGLVLLFLSIKTLFSPIKSQ